MKICFVTPRIPPARCGVGDYTMALARDLSDSHDVTIVTARDQTSSVAPGILVMPVVPGWGPCGMVTLWKTLRALRPSWTSVQYVPYLYHRWGLNLSLPLLVLLLRAAGMSVVLHVHEPFVPLDTPKHIAAGMVQRVALALLAIGSRKVVVTISTWTAMLRRWLFWRAQDVIWLPAGSNIPRVPCTEKERRRLRASLGAGEQDVVLAVMSPFAAGKLDDFVRQAWARIAPRRDVHLLVIGTDSQDTNRLPAGERVISVGYVTPETVSRLLSASDIFLCPFIDGLSSRRTSALAAMEHGLAIVSTWGNSTDEPLFAGAPMILTDARSVEEFCARVEWLVDRPEERATLGRDVSRFFQQHFDRGLLADRLLRELGECPARPDRTAGAHRGA